MIVRDHLSHAILFLNSKALKNMYNINVVEIKQRCSLCRNFLIVRKKMRIRDTEILSLFLSMNSCLTIIQTL